MILIIHVQLFKSQKKFSKACLESKQWYHRMHTDRQLKYVKHLGMAELAHIPVTSPRLLQLTFLDPLYQWAGSISGSSLPRTPVYLVTCAAHCGLFNTELNRELPHCK